MYKLLCVLICSMFIGCAKEPIKIGVVLPLSQTLSSYGDLCLKGINLAAKIINEKGGIKGRKIELLIEDNKGDKKITQTILEKFDKEKVVVGIGPLTTKNTLWIGEYVDKIKLPLITPTATGIEATRNREWVWRISFTDPFQGIMLAKFVITKLKAFTACILMDPNDPYSVGLCEQFEKEYKKQGGKILFRTTFNAGDTSFTEQLKVIKKHNPECLFIPAFYQEAGLIIKSGRDMGLTQPFIGGDGWDSPELYEIVGDREGANYYSTHFFYNYGGTEVQDFLHGFRTEYETEPHTFSALGYDALMVIRECLKLTRNCTRKEFKEKIKKVRFLGATGTIDFTQTRDPRRSLMVLKFEPGTPTEVIATY